MAEIEDLKIVGGSTYTVGNQDIIANAWEAGVTYVKDKSYVIQEHKLYVCNVTHTSVEPFDTTKWTEITVGEAIAANTTAIGSLSQLTTTVKSSLVGAVNEVDKYTPEINDYTATTNANGVIDSNTLVTGGIPVNSYNITSVIVKSNLYVCLLGYYNGRYLFVLRDRDTLGAVGSVSVDIRVVMIANQ